MMRALVQDVPDVTVNQAESTPSPEGGDSRGTAVASDASHAVAESLAADVLAALAVEADGLPPGEPWQALGMGEASLTPVMGAALPVFPSSPMTSEHALASPAVEQAAAEAAYAELRSDVARLEELLTEQSVALREARAEAEQLRAIGRDTASRFDALPDAAAELGRARVERDHAAARAIEAEAGRAELAFQLDEVRGHLLAVGAAEGGLPGEPLHTTCARLTGTVRGLLAARAEADERRDTGWARALLLEQDLEDARIAVRSLERDLGETREQHELALVEARTLAGQLAGTVGARAAAELRGELAGLRARADEAELALSRASTRAAEQGAVGAQGERELAAAHTRIAELERALAHETENVAEAESQLAKAGAERLVTSAQVERLQAALGGLQGELDEREAQLEQARMLQRSELDRLSEARAGVERLAAERGRAQALSTQTLHEVRSALAELSTAIEAIMGLESASVSDQTEPG